MKSNRNSVLTSRFNVMKHGQYILIGTFFALMSTGCSFVADGDDLPAMSEAEIEAAKIDIDSVRATYQYAVAALDFEALGKILYPETFFVPPGGADWQAMLASANGAPFAPGFQIQIMPQELEIMSREWAYEFGSSIASYVPEKGAARVEVRDTYLILLRNTGEGWKPYREVASSSPPPQGWPTK